MALLAMALYPQGGMIENLKVFEGLLESCPVVFSEIVIA